MIQIQNYNIIANHVADISGISKGENSKLVPHQDTLPQVSIALWEAAHDKKKHPKTA